MEPLAGFGTVAFARWAAGMTRRLPWGLPKVGDGGRPEKRREEKQLIVQCSRQVDTQLRLRAGARGGASWKPAYELSKKLHRDANCDGVRFGPMRMAAPQRGQRHVSGPGSAGPPGSRGFGVTVRSWRARLKR